MCIPFGTAAAISSTQHSFGHLDIAPAQSAGNNSRRASAAAPYNPQRGLNSPGTIRSPRATSGMTCRSNPLRSGPSRTSPACDIPPPITTTSGLTSVTARAIPSPRYSPARPMIRAASASV